MFILLMTWTDSDSHKNVCKKVCVFCWKSTLNSNIYLIQNISKSQWQWCTILIPLCQYSLKMPLSVSGEYFVVYGSLLASNFFMASVVVFSFTLGIQVKICSCLLTSLLVGPFTVKLQGDRGYWWHLRDFELMFLELQAFTCEFSCCLNLVLECLLGTQAGIRVIQSI